MNRALCTYLLIVAGCIGARADDALNWTDVFTSGSDGYHTFRIPAIVATKSGTLLAFCEGRKTGRADDGDIDMLLRRSADGGKTWGKQQLVHEEGGDAKITIGNPAPVVDQQTGFIWLTLTRNNDDVLVAHSEDDGLTWSSPRKITADVKAKNWNWYATGPGNGIQLTRGKHAGRLVIPCDHRVEGAADWKKTGHSHAIYSDDHGRTWKRGAATPSEGMNECAVVERADGTLLLNMRSYRGRGCRAVATSGDGGQTWSQSTDDETLVEPVCQASMLRYRWPSDEGDVKERSHILFVNPASKGRDKLTIRISEDEGKTWSASKLLYAGPAAYSGIVALPGGKVGVIFERDDYRHISFATFTLESLTN
jgi:sialidase-1